MKARNGFVESSLRRSIPEPAERTSALSGPFAGYAVVFGMTLYTVGHEKYTEFFLIQNSNTPQSKKTILRV